MNAIFGSPFNVAIVLIMPVVIIGIAKSLKQFNQKIAEKRQSKVEG